MSEKVDANFTLKTINDLEGKTFFVEAYQRGYKWGVQQVLDLLQDIKEFEDIGSRFYCLQPVVVKKIDASDERISEREIVNKDEVYELIDGQQRLTTTFIILSLLSNEELPFQLIYRTRPQSEKFLKDISEIDAVPFELDLEKINEIDKSINALWSEYILNHTDFNNVDNYHFFKACMLIHQWTEDKDQSAFVKKLLNKVKVIWYNTQRELNLDGSVRQEKNAEKIFINFNQGKIQLEQAELIKAFFIIKFKEITNLELRSIHINQFAEEWNTIEAQMQDNKFWYFVSNDTSDKKRYNRIDLLFDILASKPKNTEDPLFAYHYYLKSNIDIDKSLENWKELKDLFELLKEWYEDRLLYHLIGIIIYLEIQTIKGLISLYKDNTKVESKLDFEKELKKIISNELNKDKYDMVQLNYKSPKETKTVLHLFNIASYYISDFNYRFPFDKLKTQTWSLEHIHAQNADKFTEREEFIDWLEDIQPLLEDIDDRENLRILKSLKDDLNNKKLKEIKDNLIGFYNSVANVLSKDSVENLCLLDSKTNSSLGNNIFKRKRNRILEIDNSGEIEYEGEKTKVFIPIATKNVFLKYYTTETSEVQFTYWGRRDREDYVEKIENQLLKFLSDA